MNTLFCYKPAKRRSTNLKLDFETIFGNEGVLVRRVAAATQEYDGRTNVRTHHNIKHVF